MLHPADDDSQLNAHEREVNSDAAKDERIAGMNDLYELQQADRDRDKAEREAEDAFCDVNQD